MELILLSNTTNHGTGMFAHAAEAFREVAAGATVTFIPYALTDWDDYADRVTAALGAFGIEVASAHRSDAPDRAIRDAEVVMMGGGNSFRLLDALYGLDVIEELGARVRAGTTRYMGASAGTNVACPTIRTTNDMPICQPPSLSPRGFLPFQTNPHYDAAHPASPLLGARRGERHAGSRSESGCGQSGSGVVLSGSESRQRRPLMFVRTEVIDRRQHQTALHRCK